MARPAFAPPDTPPDEEAAGVEAGTEDEVPDVGPDAGWEVVGVTDVKAFDDGSVLEGTVRVSRVVAGSEGVEDGGVVVLESLDVL